MATLALAWYAHFVFLFIPANCDLSDSPVLMGIFSFAIPVLFVICLVRLIIFIIKAIIYRDQVMTLEQEDEYSEDSEDV